MWEEVGIGAAKVWISADFHIASIGERLNYVAPLITSR